MPPTYIVLHLALLLGIIQYSLAQNDFSSGNGNSSTGNGGSGDNGVDQGGSGSSDGGGDHGGLHIATNPPTTRSLMTLPALTQATKPLGGSGGDSGGGQSGHSGNCYLGYSKAYDRPECFWYNCYGYCQWLGALGKSISYNNWVYQNNLYLGFNHRRSNAFWDVCKSNCKYF